MHLPTIDFQGSCSGEYSIEFSHEFQNTGRIHSMKLLVVFFRDPRIIPTKPGSRIPRLYALRNQGFFHCAFANDTRWEVEPLTFIYGSPRPHVVCIALEVKAKIEEKRRRPTGSQSGTTATATTTTSSSSSSSSSLIQHPWSTIIHHIEPEIYQVLLEC